MLESDLVIGAVLIAGARAPRLVTEKMVKEMEAGSVDRRRVDRSGRLHRDRAPDHARQPDVPRRRRDPLRRREHAGRGAADVDVRADERDDQYVAHARRPRPREGGRAHSVHGHAASTRTRARSRTQRSPRRSACRTRRSRRDFNQVAYASHVRGNNSARAAGNYSCMQAVAEQKRTEFERQALVAHGLAVRRRPIG